MSDCDKKECFKQDFNFPNGYKKISNCSCELIKCPNYWFCKQKHPFLLLDCWGGRCLDCDQSFNRDLELSSVPQECNICTEEKILVKQPICNHYVSCQECFIRLHNIEEREYPDFPYSEEIQTKYEKKPFSSEEYPLIDEWVIQCDLIDDINQNIVEQTKCLRLCPLCRQKTSDFVEN